MTSTLGFALLTLVATLIAIRAVPARAGNPIIPDLIADPSISEFGGTFYLYATTDGYDGGISRCGPAVAWTSKDFINWTFNGTIFPEAEGAPYWAPSRVMEKDGKYFLYPTLAASIYAAVSDAPDGRFKLVNGPNVFRGNGRTPPLIEEKGPKGTKGIDAEVFVDDDGQAYIVWAQRGIQKLAPDFKTLQGEPEVIKTKRGGYSEGPYLIKRKDVYYYLYTLSGHEDYQYAYMMSRTSPMGPWEAAENDIIARTNSEKKIYGPGHGSFFSPQGTDDWYFAYLEFGRGGANRQVWVDKMEFNDDGTIKPITLTHEGVGALRKPLRDDKNLAAGAKVTASSQRAALKVKPIKDPAIDRTETFDPANATDGSFGTRWLADADQFQPWLQIDLGEVKEIKRTEAYFVQPTAGHAYRIECSVDGKTWEPYGGHDDWRMQSPHTDTRSAKARYLKLTILKGMGGIWDLKVF